MEAKYITVQLLGSGYAAVCVWLNNEEPDLGPFWEPWQTGNGRYATHDEAAAEAMQWAFDEDLPYISTEGELAVYMNGLQVTT